MRTCEQSRESSVFTKNLIRQDLNYNESAALIDAHLKMYKFRTEADIVATQSSIDWISSDATSLVKDQGQNCRMYSTTEGIAVKTQQIIDCDTTDEDCNGVDLITVFNYVMDAGCIVSIACIDIDVDYTESSNEGDGGYCYYYGYYYGSEQALRCDKLEGLMKCSYQSGYKFDQINLELKVVLELGEISTREGEVRF